MFWSIKYSGEVLNKLNSRGFRGTSLSTYEGSLKLEMLSLARTSKYLDNTIVLSINKTEETTKTERTHQIR